MKHKHYDLILAWANGAQIEQKYSAVWMLVARPHWHDEYEYRVKPIIAPVEQDITELLARLEAAEADAARYRWLRASEDDRAIVMTWVDVLDNYVPWASPEDVDAEVDTLRAQAKK